MTPTSAVIVSEAKQSRGGCVNPIENRSNATGEIAQFLAGRGVKIGAAPT
jgi:hypothetical protein